MHYFVKERICCIAKPTWIIEDYESWEQKIQIPLGLRLDEELATLRKTPTTDNNWNNGFTVCLVCLIILSFIGKYTRIHFLFYKKKYWLHPPPILMGGWSTIWAKIHWQICLIMHKSAATQKLWGRSAWRYKRTFAMTDLHGNLI